MKLTEEQKHVILEVMKFKKSITKVSGYAGTGKSTIVAHIQKALPTFSVCAFTGKAAQVLRKKGMDASTIHSLIYKPELDERGNIVLDANGNPNFILTDDLPCEGFLVDEASMVGLDIYKDLCAFNKPIIFFGDHGQLEPIGEGLNLMKEPDFTLETIHRNAGEIAHFAEFIRKGFRPAAWAYKSGTGSKVEFVSKYDAENYYLGADQIICAFNKTRVQVNEQVRKFKNIDSKWPIVGDKVMCLRNDRTLGIFNGMQGIVKELFKKPKNKMILCDGDIEHEITFDPSQFNKVKYDFEYEKDAPAPMDFAYCITGHKSQGDEFKKTLIIEQRCDLWEHQRWAYTVASRAKEEIKWVA